MANQTFVFVKNENENTFGRATKITPNHLFSSSVGYGFITEVNREKEELLQIPEANSGICQAPDFEAKTCIDADENGCFVYKGDEMPLMFKAEVSRLGNYEISMTLYGRGKISVFSGCRNLVYQEDLEKESEVEVNFNVKLISMILNEKNCMYENRSIDIAILGKYVRLKKLSVKECNCPTLFIAGDSYISNRFCYYPYSSVKSTAGWGQMLPVCVKKGIACYNYAKDTLKVDSFRLEGHFSLTQAHMKLGDYLLLHFASNDDEKRLDSFFQGMGEFIEEARAMGVYPILASPLAAFWINEKKAFEGIYRELAQKFNVPYVDISGTFTELTGFLDEQGYLTDEGAIKVAKTFSKELVTQIGGGKPDPYTKLAKYFS